MSEPMLVLDRVSRTFDAPAPTLWSRRRRVHAVSDVSLAMSAGESFGLVGESGCGKSTLGRLVAGLLPPTSGAVRLHDSSRGVQMIFQNPIASLNPRKSVRQTLREPLRVHRIAHSMADADAQVQRLAAEVGFDPQLLDRRPHELSGGQCQRVGIARALAVAPELLVCDEPVSALDVSIQAQVLNLLADLRERTAISYFFISHDLGVVERVSDRVGVMYLGRLVEVAPTAALFAQPLHPYTQLLLDSVPRLDAVRESPLPPGEAASALAPPPGCAFHPRCPLAQDVCRREVPPLRSVGPQRQVACHLVEAAADA
jgi:peptide/nickel transport system ATP-binding protein